MITTLDHTSIAKIQNQSDMNKFVATLGLKSDTVIIKPNWVEAAEGAYTDAKVLDQFLASLTNKKIYLVESSTFWRHQQFFEHETDSFSSKEAQLETGKKHLDFFKEADNWFLKHSGFDKIIKKYHITYVNVTLELWAGHESPVPLVPQVLYDLKGSDFVSFARMKGDGDYGASLSIKNLFGLYPDPNRFAKYHGEDDVLLEPSIIEINRIYRSLFNMISVVDGVNFTIFVDFGNKIIKLTKNQQIIVGGNDAVQVDDTSLKLMQRQLSGPLENLLTDYQKRFGGTLQYQEIPQDYMIEFPKP